MERHTILVLAVGAAVVLGLAVFVASSGGQAGTQKWSFETGNVVFSSPTVVDGTVYVGSDNGNLYAIDTDASGTAGQ